MVALTQEMVQFEMDENVPVAFEKDSRVMRAWWQRAEVRALYPILATAAQLLLFIPATSATVERFNKLVKLLAERMGPNAQEQYCADRVIVEGRMRLKRK